MKWCGEIHTSLCIQADRQAGDHNKVTLIEQILMARSGLHRARGKSQVAVNVGRTRIHSRTAQSETHWDTLRHTEYIKQRAKVRPWFRC